ncbi:MAG: ABC transporter ATP-binding protein [Peptostreptococcaceae bacterium]|nr:ABC transporter ATP-binding protein [Peptostreptococcaceae bacterium]
MERTVSSDIKKTDPTERRSGLTIMRQLIGLVRPLLPIMIMAIVLGVVGFLCAIFLTILAGFGVLRIATDIPVGLSLGKIFVLIILFAVMRGVFHYGEQYCNHYIAFKLLAIIRNKVFSVLRKLCPAKLEGRDKGDLISLITSDIELLEVFYAHTISPIAIAVLTSIIMIGFIGHYSTAAAFLALIGYIVVGVFIPLYNGRRGAQSGMDLRNTLGEFNGFILDSLRGLDETIQYNRAEKRLEEMVHRSDDVSIEQKDLNRLEASQRSITNLAILLFSFAMLFLMLNFYIKGQVDLKQMLIPVMSMMGSFGPVVALSNLSNNLHHTLACGERVLSLLEEQPKVEEVSGKQEVVFDGSEVRNVDFSYEEEQILKDYSLEFPKGEIVGIHGVSGSGKSTLLKLLMRFWDVQKGSINISKTDVRDINTTDLRDMQSYVTQETHLFHDSIANNISIGKPGATREEITAAAKKASIHDMIISLPNGYDTEVGELGDTLSGGEKQRIGIARAFLHDAPFLLLDEPTSNLDSLNEGMILKSLNESCQHKTVILVSHRRSTMNIAHTVYHMENGRIS